MAKVLLIIAPKNFRDEELFQPKEVLEGAGHSCTIASTTTNECTGMLGATVKPDVNVAGVDANDYDAIVMIGGSGSLELVGNKAVLDLFRDAKEKGKIIGAICAGPLVPANAGVLRGVAATMFPNPEYIKKLKSLGVDYVEKDVVVDGRIVTACGPKAAKEFGKALAGLL